MSQIYKDSNAASGGSINTLSGDNGPATPPNGNNFNFSGNILDGSAANGAIEFITPGGPLANQNGQMDVNVRVDDVTVKINSSNQLEAAAQSRWQTITVDTAAVENTSYIVNSAGLVTVTLPSGTPIGTYVTIYEVNTGTFTVAQGAAQQIQFGAQITTAGAGSKLTSQRTGDYVTLVSNSGGTEWISIPYNGNFIVG